jgi:hypothetical protein
VTDSGFVLAYMDGGDVAAMPVDDRDQFQRGVVAAAAWETMSGADRSAPRREQRRPRADRPTGAGPQGAVEGVPRRARWP